ncbi:GNAT family N-acetyltransferase [Streptomyces sp. NPDC059009]|uniref:GNAT family N-acetyltransferase n=1 Tax=Streptomyces sp. NPDC059009 TaxID=3346694 RepID=UPI003687091A
MRRLEPAKPGGTRRVAAEDERGVLVGLVEYRVCDACCTGRIDTVWVAPSLQGQGLARDALHLAMERAPGHVWETSQQSASGRAFFAAMGDEMECAFPVARSSGSFSLRWPHWRGAVRAGWCRCAG